MWNSVLGLRCSGCSKKNYLKMQLFANLAYCDENSYCYIYKHFRFFNFEPVSPVPHSVKFSWFLSEFIVLKVEDRNLASALLRKILGSDGKNIDFRFNYTPECMVTRMHFLNSFGEGSPSVSTDFYPRSISGCAFDLGFTLNSRALAPSIGWIGSGFALNSPPPTFLLTPPPTEGD